MDIFKVQKLDDTIKVKFEAKINKNIQITSITYISAVACDDAYFHGYSGAFPSHMRKSPQNYGICFLSIGCLKGYNFTMV